MIDLCRKQIAKKYEIGQIFLFLLTGKLQFYASHINFCKKEKIFRHFVINISINSKLETREKSNNGKKYLNFGSFKSNQLTTDKDKHQ